MKINTNIFFTLTKMYFIIISENEKELELTIIKEKMINFLYNKSDQEKKENAEIDNKINDYANALYQALDFFTDCEVNVFTGNIFVTNTLNEWVEKVSQKHESWKKLVDKQTERNVVLKGFTAYKKIL